MTEGYTDTPCNIKEILPYVTTDQRIITAEILQKRLCCFYDTCSFRKHANMEPDVAAHFLRYIKEQNGMLILTRCILMELASRSGVLQKEYVEYIRYIRKSGLSVFLIYEEDLFSVMEMAFSTNGAINHYLCWAVRTLKNPVSTITEMLEKHRDIEDEVIRGKNLDQRGVYKHFFEAARDHKASGDNLGEELLAICLHILSHLPGERDGKFCILTDDKGAAGKIDALFQKTAKQYRGKKIVIYSTPKLVQMMYREHFLKDRETINTILRTGNDGNIVVLGTEVFDLRSREISKSSEELTDLIMKPNGIQIIF
ncbi:MAG: hypothetical protein ACLTKI_00555 [Lachnospiraceae bacterium]